MLDFVLYLLSKINFIEVLEGRVKMDNIVKNESRRDFLKVSGTVASGLALGFYLPQGPRVAQATASHSPNAWITIGN